MKLIPTNVGAEPKKLAILGIVLVVLGGVYWMNNRGDGSPGGTATGVNSPIPAIPSLPASSRTAPASGAKLQVRGGGRTVEDFHPTLKLPEGIDLGRIDPTIKFELLAKLRSVPEQSGARSLFEFYTPPPPPPPVKPINPVPPPVVSTAKPPPTGPPPVPPPPPIPLKFYGYANAPGTRVRKAYFLDGDDIFLEEEGKTIRNRYKIIRIGTAEAEVEDTVNKNTQKLPLVMELPG